MTTPYLRVAGLSKSFPGVRALADFDFDVQLGEVHALVGQNGAGKSTFIKIVAGDYVPDAGTIEVEGTAVTVADAQQASALGIAVIHQDLNLVPIFDVTENMMLGMPAPKKAGFLIDRAAMHAKVADTLSLLEVDFEPTTPIGALSVPEQQMVAIGRALMLNSKILIMDEPTASLGAHEVEQVFRVVNFLRSQGRSVIYVSHRLEEVSHLADRITVMRDGRLVGTFARGEIQSRSQLVQLIIGRPERDLVRAEHHTTGAVVLRARELSWRDRVKDVSVDIHAGEVTGIAGLVGSGRSELAGLIFGAERPDSGTVEIQGKVVAKATPGAGIKAGVALAPEDRRGRGAFVGMTLRENLTISSLKRFSRGPWIQKDREVAAYDTAREQLGIVARGSETRLAQLSGGNQQKVVIAKWLQTSADILVLDEPTQGVDVGAQEEIHRLVRDLAHQGKAVIFISSDLEETLRVSDRTLVMREGSIVGDLRGDDATIDQVLSLCFGTDDVPIGTEL